MSNDEKSNDGAHAGEIDDVTGVETTGHEWDGIKELNKPLPKWWLYVFYATVVWAVGYWVLYPAWPTMAGYTKGVLGYSQRSVVSAAVEANREGQAKFRKAIAETELGEIRKDPELLRFAIAAAEANFGENCAGCHGRGAQGFEGYPNLNDDDWIWGGTLEDIHLTIQHGIRADNDDSRFNAMPRFGLDGILPPEQINDVATYVMSLSGSVEDQEAKVRGEQIYADQCGFCHGPNGEGDPAQGAPNLSDGIWLYGGDREDIVTSIETGRGGMMPAWNGRLDPVTIKSLAVYVHSLGGGE